MKTHALLLLEHLYNMAADVWMIQEGKVAVAMSPMTYMFPAAGVAEDQKLGGLKQ